MVYRPREGGAEAAWSGPESVGAQGRRPASRVTKSRVVLGRGSDCDIPLSDPNVSRRHAELRQEGSAYWIVDLDSTNGTEVNGEQATRAKLEDGDRILIGSTELVFERSVPSSSDLA